MKKPEVILELEKELAIEFINVEFSEIVQSLESLIYRTVSHQKNLRNQYSVNDLGQINGLWSISELLNLSFLREMPELECLGIMNTKISNFQPIETLQKLRILDLSMNEVVELKFLEMLTNLKALNLSRNQITDISELGKLGVLTELSLAKNMISDFSPLESLTQLRSLNLAISRIEDISFVKNLYNLEKLNLETNKISDISKFAKLTNIKQMNLMKNKINDITVIKKLTKLTDIRLSENIITDISSIQDLSELVILILNINKISDLTVLKGLDSLKTISIYKNQITDLTNLPYFPNLEYLDLSNNQIPSISYNVFEKVPKLKDLYMNENPMNAIPKEYFEKRSKFLFYERYNCLSSLIAFLKESKEYIYEAKLLLLGHPKAGKTSLMKKLIKPNCELEKESSTHGINTEFWSFDYTNPKNTPSKPVDGKFKTHIFDFGGDEILQTTHRYFIRSRSLYLLVVDSRTWETTDWENWFQSIDFYAKKTEVGLDKETPIIVVFNNQESRWHNPRLEKKWENLYNIVDVIQVDLKDNRNLDLLIKRIQFHLQNLSHVGTEQHLKEWRGILDLLKEKYSDRDILTIEEYRTLCKNISLYSDDANRSLILLDLLGYILYFRNSKLAHTIILKKEWATEAAYEVFWFDKVEKTGRFNRSELPSILEKTKSHYFESNYDFLLNLMEQFGIVYKSGNVLEDIYIVPALLGMDPPDSYNGILSNDSFRIQIAFEDYMPKGILPQFISRYNVYIHDSIQWRKGVLLNLQREIRSVHPALVEIIEVNEKGKQHIEITISGEKKKEAFIIVYKTMLMKIIEDIDINKKLTPALKIACKCNECNASREPSYFEYTTLQKWLESRGNKATAQCTTSGEIFSVSNILKDYDIENISLYEDEEDIYLQKLEEIISINEKTEKRTKIIQKRIKKVSRDTKEINTTTKSIDSKFDLFNNEFKSIKQNESIELDTKFIQITNLILTQFHKEDNFKFKRQLDTQFSKSWETKLDSVSRDYLLSAEYLFEYLGKNQI